MSLPPPRATSATRAFALVTVGAALAACGSVVEVAPADRAGDPLCAKVAAAWPATVARQNRVATSADDSGAAAWGDPAIIARCGVTSPGPTTHDCIEADGIDWVAIPLDDGTRFVSYGRSPAVEILVPDAYAPEGLLLPAFAEAAAHVPQGERRCL